MKLKVVHRDFRLEETDLEYPQYFYFQSEGWCLDEVVMVTEHGAIIVEYKPDSLEIRSERDYQVEPHYIERNLTTRDRFMEVYNRAIDYINETAEI